MDPSKFLIRPLDLNIEGTESFRKYVIAVHGNGDCFIHSMCTAIYKRYVDEPNLRMQFGRQIRVEISRKLDQINPHDPGGRTYYESAGDGYMMEEFAKDNPEFRKDEVARHLSSNECLGDGMIHLISGAMGKSVFYIDGGSRDIYSMPGIQNMNLHCVVIYYSGGHYETVGIMEDGLLVTHFSSNHPFIQALYMRTLKLKEKDYV